MPRRRPPTPTPTPPCRCTPRRRRRRRCRRTQLPLNKRQSRLPILNPVSLMRIRIIPITAIRIRRIAIRLDFRRGRTLEA